MDPHADALLLWDIYEEHLDEAEFLWTQWERALISPRYQLVDLHGGEERLLARLDGLTLGGAGVAERLLAPALEAKEPFRVSAAAFALITSESPGTCEAVLACLKEEAPVPVAAIPRALELMSRETLLQWFQRLFDMPSPSLQAVALALPVSFEAAPPGILAELIMHEAPQVSSAALRALARSRAGIGRGQLLRLLDSPYPIVREAAIEAGLIGRHREAWEACLAAISDPEGRLQRLLVAMGGDESHLRNLQALLDNPKLRRDALWALGYSGRVSCADTCVALLQDESVAALAAEAFCAITGLQLDGLYVAKRSTPTEDPVPLDEEDLDADLVPSVEDLLPLPDAAAVSKWWEENRPCFEPHQRYLGGKALKPEVMLEALEHAPLRRRHVLALDVLIRSRGQVRIPTRTFVRQQASILQSLRTTSSASLWAHPFTDGLTSMSGT